MPYTVAWDESVPAGNTDARFIDDRMRDRMTAIRERLADVLGGLTLLEFQADPILVKGLKGGGSPDFLLQGGTATTTLSGSDGVNDDLQVDHATGDATVRRYIKALGGFRSTLEGWSVSDAGATQPPTEIIRPQGRALMVRTGSVLSVAIAADPNQATAAGDLSVEVWKGTIDPASGARVDVATGLIVQLSVANPCYNVTTQAMDLDQFTIGDELFVKWYSAVAWAPTTLDFRVAVEIET